VIYKFKISLLCLCLLFLAGCGHIDINDDEDWEDIKLEGELEEIRQN
jgi:hypothetical protein